MMNGTIRVVLTGGLSGGHTFPLVAVARALREQATAEGKEIEFLYIGSKGPFEAEAMATENIPATFITVGKVRRYFSFANFMAPCRVVIGFVQSLWKLYRFMPDVVFAKGGAVTVPVGLAAWLYRIPLLIHDSDAAAGRANRLLSHFASRIAIAYPSTREYFPEAKTALTGNPVRSDILRGTREGAYARFHGLSSERPTLFVFGGSLGAERLNNAFFSILSALLKSGIQVIHQTGAAHYQTAVNRAGEEGVKVDHDYYFPRAFLSAEEMGDAYAVADVILSRSGASSVSEIAAYGKPAIFVPLGSAANDEQRLNAYAVAKAGGAIVLEENNLGENLLFSRIRELFDNVEFRTTLGEKARSFFHTDAATVIARGILDLVK